MPYVALDKNDPRLKDDDTTFGVNLFKYDPAHNTGRRARKQLAMIWFEDDEVPYHKDQW
jgi:hypothetical protein